MLTRHVLRMVIIVLTCTSFSYGWQNQPSSAAPGALYPASTLSSTGQPQNQGVPQYGGLAQPVPQNQPPQPVNARQDHYPQYPYPPYHNPYYSGNGMSAKKMLSHTIDWFLSLPSNLADQISSFVDNRFFPETPATHGGQSHSQLQGQIPQSSNTGSPQAVPGTVPVTNR
jgi:hypothetical protein